MWDTFACATAKFLTHFIISIAVPENVPPDTGLQKRATFSTLNVGLAGTGNQTRAPAWQAEALTAQPSTTPRLGEELCQGFELLSNSPILLKSEKTQNNLVVDNKILLKSS
jgi:hypothetical protein